MPLGWVHSIRLLALLVSIAAAAVKPASGQTQIAVDATVAALRETPESVAVERAVATMEAGMARDLWTDPQIKNFIGLSENAYDFTDPSGVPGFGPVISTDAMR